MSNDVPGVPGVPESPDVPESSDVPDSCCFPCIKDPFFDIADCPAYAQTEKDMILILITMSIASLF